MERSQPLRGNRVILNRLSPRTRLSLNEWLRRIDRVAAELNVLLVVIAVGLAALDATLLVTRQVVDHLPPITRISHDSPAQGANDTPSKTPN
jgi:hypothetical protein